MASQHQTSTPTRRHQPAGNAPARNSDLVSGCDATHCKSASALQTRLDAVAVKVGGDSDGYIDIISCSSAAMVPKECHSIGARSGKSSRFLLSSSRAVSRMLLSLCVSCATCEVCNTRRQEGKGVRYQRYKTPRLKPQPCVCAPSVHFESSHCFLQEGAMWSTSQRWRRIHHLLHELRVRLRREWGHPGSGHV